MYIEQIEITDYRVFKDTLIRFKGPKNNQNVINIIAGVNGSGKTTLLMAMYEYLILNQNHDSLIVRFSEIKNSFSRVSENRGAWTSAYTFLGNLETKNKDKVGPFEDPRLIFIPAQLSFDYRAISQLNIAYSRAIKIDKEVLGKAEFYIKEFILSKERQSSIADPVQRTRAAVDAFNRHFAETSLLTRLHDLDAKRYNRPVFKNVKGDLVTIDQLSDGEKQLYGRVVALMMLEPRNSMILIDEPEISLHPAWQQEIMKIYAGIGVNNQFIIATHSPQIIGNTPHENLIVLVREEGRIVPMDQEHPPAGIDVNSILTEIMGAPVRPREVEDLYRRYRELVEQGREESEEGKNIRKRITAREGASEFIQEMDFTVQLRDVS